MGIFYSGIGTALLPAPTPTHPALPPWKSLLPVAVCAQDSGEVLPRV